MDTPSSSLHILSIRSSLIALILISSLLHLSLCNQLQANEGEEEGLGRRRLLGFKEKPAGSNNTFKCSPSGPCVPCQYSEKNDDKYRCSETGYRIPFKCKKIGDVTKEANGKGPQTSSSTEEGSVSSENSAVKHRTLADKTSGPKGELKEYLTYRSCIQGVNEEKLSVLGFEKLLERFLASVKGAWPNASYLCLVTANVLILGLLLVSGSFIFFRRKKVVAMAGAGNARVQSNSRF